VLALLTATPAAATSNGDRLFAAGDYAAALAAYAEQVATHPEAPDLPDTFLKMARCHLRLHRPWLAEVRLRRLLADNLESDAGAQAAILLDRLLDQRQRWSEALHLADTLLAHHPRRARPALLAMRAHALVALGRHQEAAHAYAALHEVLSPAQQRGEATEVERWLARRPEPFLRWVIRELDTAFPSDYALLSLIDRYRERDPRLARRLADHFLDTFPDHPRAAALRPQPPPVAVAVTPPPPPVVARRYDPERIDLLLPTTGPLAEVGIALFQGATLAVERYNAERDREAPGALQVTLTLHDTGANEAGAEAALQGLLDREVLPLAVVGPATSLACRRLAPLATVAGLPLVTPSAAATDLPDAYPYLFRVGMSDASQVARLLDYAVGERGAYRLACIYPNNGYGAHFRDLFVERARCLGVEVVAQASYPPDGVDFGPPIRNLLAQERAANARLVADRPFIPESPDPALPRLPWPPDGTLLPGPKMAASLPESLRAIAEGGHEIGIHCWDHAKWQDRLHRMNHEAVAAEFGRARSAFREVFGIEARTSAAPGWITSAASLAVQDEAGLDYCSDMRGAEPFFPVLEGRTFSTLQIPTTLPTLDEILGREVEKDDEIADYYLSRLLPEGLQVMTLHTETEGRGRREAFRCILEGIRGKRTTLLLGDVARSCLEEKDRIPRCRVEYGEIPGRAGKLSLQGERIA